MLGALNAITHELVTIINDAYINSQSGCDLLWKIAGLGLQTPVRLVLDNARYQRAKLVGQLAAELKIELLFLPPYSPNLNLIERLWKFSKSSASIPNTMPSFKASATPSSTVYNKHIPPTNNN